MKVCNVKRSTESRRECLRCFHKGILKTLLLELRDKQGDYLNQELSYLKSFTILLNGRNERRAFGSIAMIKILYESLEKIIKDKDFNVFRD